MLQYKDFDGQHHQNIDQIIIINESHVLSIATK